MTQPTTSLTKFKDCLRVPPTLHPQQMDDQRYSLRVQMRPAQIQLHSDLPPSEVWTYEGSLPGPIMEIARGQRVQIEWINVLPADQAYPITAVTAPDGTQNEPGRSGRPANTTVAELVPWTVVHLHGGRTAAVSDGWTENAMLSGQATTSDYANDQQAALLWYHDHAMGITRFNVYAGLAGLYIIRDQALCACYSMPALRPYPKTRT
jgi:o-aminophenol oxidase